MEIKMMMMMMMSNCVNYVTETFVYSEYNKKPYLYVYVLLEKFFSFCYIIYGPIQFSF
jgi:hypothetical protein